MSYYGLNSKSIIRVLRTAEKSNMAIIDTVQLRKCVHYCDIRGSWKLYQKTSFLGETLKTVMLMNKNIKFCACKYEIFLNNTLHLK